METVMYFVIGLLFIEAKLALVAVMLLWTELKAIRKSTHQVIFPAGHQVIPEDQVSDMPTSPYQEQLEQKFNEANGL